MSEENQVDTSVEETTVNQDDYEQDDSTGEAETEAVTESSQQQSSETPEQKQGRLKRQAEREAKKQGISLEEYLGIRQKEEKEGSEESSKKEVDRYDRIELKVEGVTSKAEQDVVLDYIKEMRDLGRDVDVSTALKSKVVREDLARIKSKATVPAPSNRTGNTSGDSFDYWKREAKKGNFPRGDKEMMERLAKARIFTT